MCYTLNYLLYVCIVILLTKSNTVMVEKFIALVFGVVSLIIEALISMSTPSVESITAAVFALAIVVLMVLMIRKERKNVVVIEDNESKGKRDIDNALKLANEIKPFIKKKDGRISIKILKD